MGSMGLHREPGLTDLEFFTANWPDALGEGGYWTVLAHNSDREGFYAAIRDSGYADKPEMEQYFILVINYPPLKGQVRGSLPPLDVVFRLRRAG